MELSQRLDVSALGLEPDKDTDTSVESRLSDLVTRIIGETPDPETTLGELGITSLNRVELAVRVEQEFGVRADDSRYSDELTLTELIGIISEEES